MKKRDENSQLEMLEDGKSMGAGAATIASAGAAVAIGFFLFKNPLKALFTHIQPAPEPISFLVAFRNMPKSWALIMFKN